MSNVVNFKYKPQYPTPHRRKHHTAAILFTNNVGGRNSNQGGAGLIAVCGNISWANPCSFFWWTACLLLPGALSFDSCYDLDFALKVKL